MNLTVFMLGCGHSAGPALSSGSYSIRVHSSFAAFLETLRVIAPGGEGWDSVLRVGCPVFNRGETINTGPQNSE